LPCESRLFPCACPVLMEGQESACHFRQALGLPAIADRGDIPCWLLQETVQIRGRSSTREPGDCSALPGADLRVCGGVFLLGIALNCLGVRMTESRANRLQVHPSVDQLRGVHVPELVDCGGGIVRHPMR
jgi:hypothetical protein